MNESAHGGTDDEARGIIRLDRRITGRPVGVASADGRDGAATARRIVAEARQRHQSQERSLIRTNLAFC
jgi:hypothetical protein